MPRKDPLQMNKFNIFKDINAKFKIADFKQPSSAKEYEKLISSSQILIPSDYKSIILLGSEIEILIGNDQYIRIWGASRCLEMNEAYNIQKNIPQSLAIGDDEGGKVLIYLTGKNGFGLYLTSFGNLDIEDAEYITLSLFDLLVNCSGVNKLYYDD